MKLALKQQATVSRFITDDWEIVSQNTDFDRNLTVQLKRMRIFSHSYHCLYANSGYCAEHQVIVVEKGGKVRFQKTTFYHRVWAFCNYPKGKPNPTKEYVFFRCPMTGEWRKGQQLELEFLC